MHILVCYMWYLPPDGAGIKRFNEFCRLWSDVDGVRITVLTSTVDHNSGSLMPAAAGKPYIWEEDGKVKLLRVNLPNTYAKGFKGRALAQIGWAYNARRALAQIERPDIVIASSPHLWVTLPGVAAKRKWKIPLILEVRDLWPESIVQTQVAGWNHPGVCYLSVLEKWAYKQADHIVTVVQTQINNIAERRLAPRDIMSTITNGVLLEDYDQLPDSKRSEIREKLGVGNGQQLVMYVGAHGKLNDLIVLVEIAEKLKHRQDLKFVSVGDGPERIPLAEETKRRGLTNLSFTGPVPGDEVPAYLSACDIGCSLVNTRKHDRYDNKTWGVFRNTYFDYAGAKKPVVFNVPGFPVDEIQNRAKGGLFASTANGCQEAVKQIVYLADNPDAARDMGENNYREIAVRYNRRKMADQYLELMQRLIG